jgi:DNA-binding protein H-NS
MSIYQELLAKKATLDKQAAELEKQLQEARREERAVVIAEIRELMSQHGLTVADLGGVAGSVKASKRALAGTTVAPKYRDPETGTTWTGRGLQPKWVKAALANGKTLDELKI